MGDILFHLSSALVVAAFIGQIVGFALSQGRMRYAILRVVLFVLWGGLVALLFLLLIRFNYCEAGCSDRPVNAQTWLIHACWLVLNVGALWLSLRGVAFPGRKGR